MNMNVSKNCEIKFEILFLNHNAFFPNTFLIRIKMKTSIKSAIPNAIKLARDIRADCLKIKSYAGSFFIKRTEGGSEVAKSENMNKKKIITSPDLMMLRILSGPYTSVMMSFIEKTKGSKKSETLPLSLRKVVLKIGKVFPPITSADTLQKIYKEIRKSIL
jgi:hypothetical protein